MRRKQRGPTQEELAALRAELEEARRHYELVPLGLRAKAVGWKREHACVFAMEIRGEWYVFRGATLKESQTLTAIARVDLYPEESNTSLTTLAQEYFIRSTLLYPENLKLDDMLQGEVHALFKGMLQATGFADLEGFFEAVEASRGRLQGSTDDIVTAFVCKGLNVTPSDVLKLDMPTLCRYIAMAEYVIGEPLPLQLKGRPQLTQEHYDLARDQASHPSMRGGVPRADPGTYPGIPPRARPPLDGGLQPGIPQRAQPPAPAATQSGIKQGVINTEQENAEMNRFMNG